MTEFVLALVVAVIAGWLFVIGRGNWIVRAVVICLLVLSSLYVFTLITKYRGTPRQGSVPDSSMVYGSVVDEGSGFIYLFCDEDGGLPPESLQVEYSEDLHRALRMGKEMFGENPFMISQARESQGDTEGEISGSDDSDQENGKQSESISFGRFSIDMPPVSIMPAKR